MGKFQLREYQKKAVEDIKEGFKTYSSILFQMPTGTGKTEVFSAYIKHVVSTASTEGKKVLVLAHTRELVMQTQKRLFERCSLPSSLIMAGFPIDLENYQIQIASVQTLRKRILNPKNVSLVVIDEAHHATSNTYRKIINFYKEKGAKILGATATPQRLDGTGFTDLFEHLIPSNPVKQFIEEGHLSPFKHLSVANFDLEDVPLRNGDYDIESLFKIVSKPKIIADVVKSYLDYSKGRKALIFAVNREHSRLIIERFKSLKNEEIKCAFIDSETPYNERQQIVEDFKANKYFILSNVQIFTEGYDCPDIETVILARPTKSLTLYLQMVGRVMRPSVNKQALILDNAMLYLEHKLVDSDREWKLEGNCVVTSKTTVKVSNNHYGEPIVQEVPAIMKPIALGKQGDYVKLKLKQHQDGKPFEYVYPKKIQFDLRTAEGRKHLAQRFANEVQKIIMLNLASPKPDFKKNSVLSLEVFYNTQNITDKSFDNSVILEDGGKTGPFIRKIVDNSLNNIFK